MVRLNFLPFGALLGRGDKFLLEEYDIQYVPSGRDLLRLKDAAISKNRPVIFAGIDYTSVPGIGGKGEAWESLPGSLTEGRFVESSIHGRLITGGQASSQAFRALSHPSVIHVVTHGFFSDISREPANPDQAAASEKALSRGGIVLARTNGPAGETGLLTARDIRGLDLSGTQMVVLSACDTALAVP